MTEAYSPSVSFAFILPGIFWSIKDATVQSHALPQTQRSSSMVMFSDGVYGVLRCGGGLLSSVLARWYHCLPKRRSRERGCYLPTRQGHPGCGSITSHKVILWRELHGTLTMLFPVSEIVRDKHLLFVSHHLFHVKSEIIFRVASYRHEVEMDPLLRLYSSTLPYFSLRSWCAPAWLYFTAPSHHLSLMKKQLTWVSGKTHRIIL